jgi:hypothetical protein
LLVIAWWWWWWWGVGVCLRVVVSHRQGLNVAQALYLYALDALPLPFVAGPILGIPDSLAVRVFLFLLVRLS